MRATVEQARRGALLVLAALTCAGVFAQGKAASEAAKVERIEVSDVVDRIVGGGGKPRVVLLYATTCPLSRSMFPGFVSLAKEYGGRGVSFQVYSTDEPENAYWIPTFLAQNQATFNPVLIRPWVPGTLDRAMKPLGIRVGSTFTRPLVAVLTQRGDVVMQSQGETDLRPLRKAIESVAR